MFRRSVFKSQTKSTPTPLSRDDDDIGLPVSEFTIKVKLGRFKGRLRNGEMSFKFDDGPDRKTAYSDPAKSNRMVHVYTIKDLEYWVTVLNQRAQRWESEYQRPLTTAVDANLYILYSIGSKIDQAYQRVRHQMNAEGQMS